MRNDACIYHLNSPLERARRDTPGPGPRRMRPDHWTAGAGAERGKTTELREAGCGRRPTSAWLFPDRAVDAAAP